MRGTKISIPVRPWDIDKFEHLNNARYHIYYDEGRKELEKKYGVDVDTLLPQGIGLLVSRSECDFLRPVKRGETLDIRSKFEKPDGKSRLYMEHQMYVGRNLVAVGKTTHYFFNIKENRTLRPLQSFLEQFE